MFHVEHGSSDVENVSRETSDREAFVDAYGVARETLARFDAYAALLIDWQQRLNLVGPSTLPQIWHRHFADSAQLLALGRGAGPWLDIGSGAGFPGIVVALLGADHVHLVESVEKKCVFLRTVVDALDLGRRVTVHRARIEQLAPFAAATITARACAPLPTLFGWGLRFADPSTRWLLPKGASAAAEVAAAEQSFDFAADIVPSRTDAAAGIVVANDVRRR